jgi:hypothetical protein
MGKQGNIQWAQRLTDACGLIFVVVEREGGNSWFVEHKLNAVVYETDLRVYLRGRKEVELGLHPETRGGWKKRVGE